MWQSDTGRQNPAMPFQETVQQLKTALTPPAGRPGEDRQNPVLRMQILICVLILGAVLAARFWQWSWFEPCRQQYQSMMQQGLDPSSQEKLVRFAGTIVQDVQERAGTWMDRLETYEQPMTGSGGLFPQKNKTLPAGYSLENYAPDRPLALPLKEFWVSSSYGWREHPVSGTMDFHTGIDLAAGEGTPITAAQEGFVLTTGRGASYGNYVLLLHSDGVATRYCHMQYVFVRRGESVQQGEVLGTVGQTGMVTGPHLHFELMQNNIHYDPAGALGL